MRDAAAAALGGGGPCRPGGQLPGTTADGLAAEAAPGGGKRAAADGHATVAALGGGRQAACGDGW